MREKIQAWIDQLVYRFRTSLQFKVVGSFVALTTIIMVLFGIGLLTLVTQQLVNAKIDTASAEVERARVTVEEQVSSTATGSSVQVRLNSARAALTTRASQQAETQSTFDAVLLVSHRDGTVTVSPEGYRIPDKLRHFVDEGQVAYQFTPISRENGTSYNALVIGSPTASDIPGLQVYLVLSMEDDEEMLALLRMLIVGAAGALIVVLSAAGYIFIRQVINRVRAASEISERLAEGHLRERMPVEGEDEMARLAMSFNTMASSLSAKISQLEDYSELQRQFTSDVSHELRTPLTSIRIAADLIEAKSDDFDPATKRSAEVLVTQVDQFEQLLEDLLEISRHDANKADLVLHPADVRDCVHGAWSSVKELADKVGVPVFFPDHTAPLPATIEPVRVERIVKNLLANAVDHSENNPVVVRWAATEECIALTVTDHGVGLNRGDENRIFQRFWRADPSRVRHSGGTGLGLAIALEDAELHGGSLEAAGTPGVGSQFRLVLPTAPGKSIMHPPLGLRAPVKQDRDSMLAMVTRPTVTLLDVLGPDAPDTLDVADTLEEPVTEAEAHEKPQDPSDTLLKPEEKGEVR